MKTRGKKFRTGDGRLVSFAELVREPKFLAWRPRKVRVRVAETPTTKVCNRPVDGGPWDGLEVNPKHAYTTVELGRKWNFHKDTVFDIFADYPGTLKIVHPETRKRRRYTTLRIPGPVAARWWKEHTQEKVA
jgi:hypothetical protein